MQQLTNEVALTVWFNAASRTGQLKFHGTIFSSPGSSRETGHVEYPLNSYQQ